MKDWNWTMLNSWGAVILTTIGSYQTLPHTVWGTLLCAFGATVAYANLKRARRDD